MADKSSDLLPDYEKLPVSETVSLSAGLSPEAEFGAFPGPGTYCVAHTEKILFSQNVEIRTSELPRWKPRVIIDRHTS